MWPVFHCLRQPRPVNRVGDWRNGNTIFIEKSFKGRVDEPIGWMNQQVQSVQRDQVERIHQLGNWSFGLHHRPIGDAKQSKRVRFVDKREGILVDGCHNQNDRDCTVSITVMYISRCRVSSAVPVSLMW